MRKQELARLFFIEIRKIHQDESLHPLTRIESLYRLLNVLFIEATAEERIQFTTLFSRIAFTSHKFSISKQAQFYVHQFRHKANRRLRDVANGLKNPKEDQIIYLLGLKALSDSIVAIFDAEIPDEIRTILPADGFYKTSPVKIKKFEKQIRVVALEDDPEKHQFIIKAEHLPEQMLRMQYFIADRNEHFNSTIALIRKIVKFPVTLNLLDVEIDIDNVYRPRAILIEPDYLVDVTAIAECYQDNTTRPLSYLLKKFLPFEASKYLMIGNIANFFLDELMSNSDVQFADIFPKVFRLNPFAFALFDDALIREIMSMSRVHFSHLKQMVKGNFEDRIDPNDCFLEPSFYSQQYGIQGRLDVFYKNPNNVKESAIIELKSGKPYMTNAYGINHNHFAQTLLYDLLIKSAFSLEIEPENFILYSQATERQLRYAPATKTSQFEILEMRNQLYALERCLADLNLKDLDQPNIFNKLSLSNFPKAKGFVQRDVDLFQSVYQNAPELLRKYFIAFSGFAAREHLLAKTGAQGLDKLNGLASLWLNDFKEKQENFDIVSHLIIEKNELTEEEPFLTFKKSKHTNPLANFRVGDIAVLYPFAHEDHTVLSNQIFKCSIIELSKTHVKVRLRSKQFNQSIFKDFEFWNIEHDILDSSFVSIYRNLFAFLQFPETKRNLLLTTAAPQPYETNTDLKFAGLTPEQESILQKVIASKDYFLLWGPPGTGKTSQMLKHLVAYLLNHTDENILLMAFTNRAVDEICDAIESIDEKVKDDYIRIGSRYSTAPKFQAQLLNRKIEKINTRQGLKDVIEQHRIFVSTVSSMNGKSELLKLKTFNRAIIDEASQLIEPMLVGLLPHFERFVLIGDHKQLPAVVTQKNKESKIEDADLQSIGLNDLRISLFERLFNRCEAEKWDHAYSRLSHQGRMHEEIMQFPNQAFYNGYLNILPDVVEQSKVQKLTLDLQAPTDCSELESLLANRRLLFLPTKLDAQLTAKTNTHEAKLVAEIVAAYQRIYVASGKEFTEKTLGVITPYRAQIAQIRKALQEQEIETDKISIDTVERYQGGARDIIVISLCINQLTQLSSLVSLSTDGVDRKLNVALTRARSQLVVLGNSELLSANETYAKLIEHLQSDITLENQS